jgi:hypothetical protein
MKRKIMISGFFSALIILVTFSNFAASSDPAPELLDEPVKNNSLVDAIESVFVEAEDVSLEDLLEAQELIQIKVLEKLSKSTPEVSKSDIDCDELLNTINYCKQQADYYRARKEEYPNIIWKVFCNFFIRGYDYYASFFQFIYDHECG